MKRFLKAILIIGFFATALLLSLVPTYLKDFLYKPVSLPDTQMVLVNKDYSLSRTYVPKDLVVPSVNFAPGVVSENKLMREEASTALEKLFNAASSEGINLYCVSGFRSYDTQKKLYNNRVKSSGKANADKYVAEPGNSEHQTGLAMDLTNENGLHASLGAAFGQSKEGKWLENNSHKFGFIIRYPSGKEEITGYNYEPWHIRYVGHEAAKEIWKRKLTLEEYL